MLCRPMLKQAAELLGYGDCLAYAEVDSRTNYIAFILGVNNCF